MSRADAIVIGGGIVGAACADALARDGRRVLVLEAAYAGGGTTAAGMGHVVVMDDSDLQLAFSRWSSDLWTELAEEMPSAVEDDPCGTLWIAEDDEEMEHVVRRREIYRAGGVEAESVDAETLAEMEPHLRRDLLGALWVPGDRVIYAPNAARWLLARGGDRVELREGAAVEKIEARAVICGGERIEADLIVNAAGADAARLTPELPIEPRKGHLVITDRYPGFCRHQIVELGYLKSAHKMTAESVAFNVQPRATGQLMIGSSRELVGWDRSLNRPLVDRMIRRALEFMPDLANLSVLRTWIGFRPATRDKMPLIGRWEPVDGLWIAAGHEGLGITTAVATGRILADLVAGRESPVDASAFSPMRILVKSDG